MTADQFMAYPIASMLGPYAMVTLIEHLKRCHQRIVALEKLKREIESDIKSENRFIDSKPP